MVGNLVGIWGLLHTKHELLTTELASWPPQTLFLSLVYYWTFQYHFKQHGHEPH